MFGIKQFCAIVHLPEAAILTAEGTLPRLIRDARDGEIRQRSVFPSREAMLMESAMQGGRELHAFVRSSGGGWSCRRRVAERVQELLGAAPNIIIIERGLWWRCITHISHLNKDDML